MLDTKIQGLVTLVFVMMTGLIAATWAVVHKLTSKNSEQAVTKLEIKYPNEDMDQRITKLEAISMRILYELRNSEVVKDEAGLVAHFLLGRCRAPDAKVHDEGMEIILAPEEVEKAIFINAVVVKEVLEHMEKEDLIRVDGNTIVVFGTR